MNLYFDNAATSHPKPEEVYQACDQVLRAGGNAGRGGHSVSLAAAMRHFESRHEIAQFLGIADSSRLIFTSGCTASINLVLNGMVGAGRLKAGGTVLTSAFEHNAVMRPLKAIADSLSLNLVAVPAQCDALVDLEKLDSLLAARKPALCIFTRASNVTGQILDLRAVSILVEGYGIPLLIDAAQSAGIVPEQLSTSSSGVSFWVASGHKNLLGPPGIGLLYVRENELLNPPLGGGTGSGSESFSMPEDLPDRLEPGSPAVHLACGVAAGVRYLQSLPGGLPAARAHDNVLSMRFLHGLAVLNQSSIDREFGIIELVGRPSWNLNLPVEAQAQVVEDYLPVFSLRYITADKARTVDSLTQTAGLTPAKLTPAKLTPDRVAQYLDADFGMASRPGLHCALLAHQTLGTVEQGLLRVSFGHYNTEAEVDSLLAALESAWDLAH